MGKLLSPACAAPVGQLFLESVRHDIARLPEPAVEMAAALVAVQMDLPAALSDWIVAELGQCADLSRVSPIASATMRLAFASSLMHTPLDLPDTEPDFALIKALGREAALREARSFLQLLGQRLESLAAGQKG